MSITEQDIQKIKRTVLIIEDNDINREILKSILENNYNVLEATNGQEGLDVLKNNSEKIELILLDIQMPVMDGFEFLKLTRNDEIYKQIPVIVTTSDSSEEENALASGASDFVHKPYSPNVILRRVEALIRLKESINALYGTRLDQVTGLYNRSFFNYVSDKLLVNEQVGNLSYILLNIRDFSFINTAYGEQDADKLLSIIGDVLKKYDNRVILMSRYGGDSFAFVIKAETHSNKTIKEVEKAIIEASNIPNLRLRFAVYENVDKTISTVSILNRLFQTIFNPKLNIAEDIVFFDEEILKAEQKRQDIFGSMEESLANGDFKVYFQPKHSAQTRELIGAEALVRWVHPKLGFISPGDFIPLFEEHGFITKLDVYIFEKTCEFLDNLRKKGLKQIPISINLSRRDLAIFTNPDIIYTTLSKYKIDKDLIHFEITESLCGDSKDILEKAKRIHNRGFKIEIDDFGSGYSCLGMISDIPMDYLKLDITFARRLDSQITVVKHAIALAHELGALTVAEGVEDERQLEIYKNLGCDLIQGYVFSKPLSEEEFITYLKK